MRTPPQILSGLRDIAPDYDALICDVWGVLHNGVSPYLAAAEALSHFRGAHGPVILLSNAPRRPAKVLAQFKSIGVPLDCFDAIVTSGGAARADLEKRAAGGRLAMMYVGPKRDNVLFADLDIMETDAAGAKVVLCTGPYNDDIETPDDYVDLLADLRARGLTMLCANPDIVVQRGGKLVYCAGALARAYRKIGGDVVYYGKPHRAIYDVALAAVGHHVRRPLAIGDAIETDIKGANLAGIDALFIADGIHSADIGTVGVESVGALFAKTGAYARAAMRALVW